MLNLSPEVETLVRQNAQSEGLTESDYIARLVKEAVQITPTPTPKDGSHTLDAPINATDALFAEWDTEDAAMTDEERKTEDKFWNAFPEGIDQNRAASGMRSIF